MNDIAAIVLAAGASERMGRNKLLLDLGGESVVRRAARTALAAGMSPVVVVTGHEREAVEAELHGLGCTAAHNGDHAAGQHTSVGAGIAALGGEDAAADDGGAAPDDGGATPDDRGTVPARTGPGRGPGGAGACAAAVVVLADMPFVTAGMLRTVADRYRETGAPLVLSRYGDTVAPPILYARRLFGELARMDRRCGREVARRHRAEAVEVAWPATALRDLDRPEDYARARRELGGGRQDAPMGRPGPDRRDGRKLAAPGTGPGAGP